MDFKKLINERYSCRDFSSSPVEIEKLEQLLDAARLAPTAANRQAFKIYVISSSEYKSELQKIYNKEWFTNASYVLAIAVNKDESWHNALDVGYGFVDVGIVFDHVALMASEIGLASCWVAAFDYAAAKAFLKLDDKWEVAAFMPIGYAKAKVTPKRRKSIDDIVVYKI